MVSMSAMTNECVWAAQPSVSNFHSVENLAQQASPEQPVFPDMTARSADWDAENRPVWPCMPMKVEAEDALLIPNTTESLRSQIRVESQEEPLIVDDETTDQRHHFDVEEKATKQDEFVQIPSVSCLENSDVMQLSNMTSATPSTSSRLKTVPIVRKPGRRGRNQFQCSFCSKVCSTRIGQVVHERTHTGEKPFKCSFCPKMFSQLGNKAVHERIHTGEKPFVCAFCPKAFNQLGSKKVHERIHSGEKPYQCRICSQMFRYAGSKVAHERTHGSEALTNINIAENLDFQTPPSPPQEPQTIISVRAMSLPGHKRVARKREVVKGPIACRYCHKVFRRNSEMKVHERIHTGYKPFTCSYCPKSFTRSSDRLNHERVHTGDKPYKCNFCGKTFVKSSDKSRHEQIHLGIKPYKCMYCGKTFCRSSDKARHERCHTGERPFKCRFCPKTFNRKAHMIDHERIHPQVPP